MSAMDDWLLREKFNLKKKWQLVIDPKWWRMTSYPTRQHKLSDMDKNVVLQLNNGVISQNNII